MVRFRLAQFVGRLARGILRRFGRGGTSLPGRLALRIDARFLAHSVALHTLRIAVVTGTNGKTTTAHMLDRLVSAQGLRVLRNASGANMRHGLATTLLAPHADVAVLEVDEATLPLVVDDLSPEVLVVTNVFRDQLDRYGEVSHTAALIQKAVRHLPQDSCLVTNADDPFVAALESPVRRIQFGADMPAADGGAVADVRHCPRCNAPLEYTARYYAHLGRYRCPRCGFGRPQPDAWADEIAALPEHQIRLRYHTVHAAATALTLPVAGVYNAYNALAAMASTEALGLQVSREALERFTPSFGRMEAVEVSGRRMMVALVKNPTGFNEALRATRLQDGSAPYLFLINDRDADGTDVSWLWDVDIEQLRGHVHHIVSGGRRAHDMAVRIKYADLGAPVEPVPEIATALERALAQCRDGDTLFCFPTYTALIELRGLLTRQGLARHFREG